MKFTKSGKVDVSVNSHRLASKLSTVNGNAPHLPDATHELHFAVRDNGIGIPADRLDRLFKPFSQVDTATTRQYDGIGLGLAISKKLVEMMGGAIWVESAGIPGQGSTFHFTFLVQALEEHSHVYQTRKPPLIKPQNRQPETTANLPHIPNLAQNSPLRILLAEDYVTNQRVMLLILKRMGYRADVVANGQEAIEAVTHQHYDVVLMDLQMPVMDGLEATRRICQQWPKEERPCIIAVTANVTDYDREQCFAAGMDDFVGKPVQIEELANALRKCKIYQK